MSAFLASRGMVLPEGDPSDAPEARTLQGLGKRKDLYFLEALRRRGAEVFPSSVRLVDELRTAHMKTAVVSSSRNCREVLERGGLAHLFDAIVDGVDADALALPGKPSPAVFLEAARRLGAPVERTVVVEDALAGVEAGKRGGFGLVIGVDRNGAAGDLFTTAPIE